MATNNDTSNFQWSCKCSKTAPETQPTCEPIRARLQGLVLTDDTLKHISNLFLEEVKKGLERKTHNAASVKCYVTYVQDLPKGTEKGKFLAADLCCQDFRLLLCEINENGFNLKTKHCFIPEYTLFSTGAQLFDNVVNQIAKFMKEEGLTKEKRLLALTFGFPILQKGLRKGLLIKWTKGFKCTNVVGNDVVQLLKDAIERKGDIDLDVCAILNDTTGTLISCAYNHHHCKIGVIVSAGTNACYVEKQNNVELFDEEDRGSGVVLINTEWGAFGDDGALNFIKTDVDEELDENSLNRGHQIFEKMVSGLYMGELARLIIVQLTRDTYLFNGKGSAELYSNETFPVDYIYDIENDPPGIYTNCKKVLNTLGVQNVTEDDCANVRYICECVSRRSGQLVAACIAALIIKVNESRITIGLDGSVYKEHPHYHNIVVRTLERLLKRGIIKFQVVNAEDGSGRGAALLAAALSAKNNNKFV